MPYLRVVDGQPQTYSIEQLRRDNPDTSFPKEMTDVFLAEWGVYPYTMQARPEYSKLAQKAALAGIEQNGGVWSRGWVVEDLSLEDASRRVRSHRDSLLSQTDWMALSDVSMSPDWVAYRQALRDVTAQVGFPRSVVWPNKPE